MITGMANAVTIIPQWSAAEVAEVPGPMLTTEEMTLLPLKVQVAMHQVLRIPTRLSGGVPYPVLKEEEDPQEEVSNLILKIRTALLPT